MAGVHVPNTRQFSTVSHKKRSFVNKLQLYTNKANKIKGISIEYDEFFKNDFFAKEKEKKKLIKRIRLNLKEIIHDFEEENLHDDSMRDFVTHIYGTYTTHIEFLGFKTRAGKMSHTGDPKIGKPFLFGQFHKKFHYIKLGMDTNGINYIQPFFVPTPYCNMNFLIDYKEYKENNFTTSKIEEYEDEKILKNIENEDEYITHVLTSFYQDDKFYKHDEDDLVDTRMKHRNTIGNQLTFDLNELDSRYRTLGSFTNKEISNKTICYDNEQMGEYMVKCKSIIFNQGGLGPENNFEDEFEDEEEEVVLTKPEDEEKRMFDCEMLKVEKLIQLKKYYRLPYLKKWNGVSAKTLDVNTIFSDPFSFEKFIDRYSSELKEELETRLIKLNELKNPDNFYTKYFRNDECYMHDYDTEIFEEDYPNHLNEMKKEFDNISKTSFEQTYENKWRALAKIKEGNSDNNLKKCVTRKQINLKTILLKWKQLGNHYKKKMIWSAITKAFAVSTARKILINCENDFMDKSFSLVQKIMTFKILTNLRRKCITDKSSKEEIIEFVKPGVLYEVKRIMNKKKEEDKQTEIIQERKRKEDKKRKLEVGKETIKNDTRKLEEEKNLEEDNKIGSEKTNKAEDVQKIESDNKEKNSNVIAQKLLEKSFIVDNLKLLEKKLEKIITKINEGKSQDNEESKSLAEELDNLNKNKINYIKYLADLNKKKILEDSKIDVEQLHREEATKRKEIIAQQKELAKNKMAIIEEAKRKINDPVTFSAIDIPSETRIYRSQQIAKGSEFTDEIFPPKRESLCPFNQKNNSWIMPPDCEDGDMVDWEKFQFERIDVIFKTQNYQIFHDKIEAADIIQGGLGDCYFLSAIASLCKFPELVEKLFLFKEKSLDRCYGIYLRKNGAWKLILVDDYVPCFGGSKKQFAFSSAHEKEMWVVLLEKAWAKICGSYAKTIAGQSSEVFDAITNAPTELISIPQISEEEIWNKLNEGKNNNFIMTAGTGERVSEEEYESVNLVPGHAYTIVDIFEVKVNGELTKLIKIRNPWGNGEWNGDWSDNSPLWKSTISPQIKLDNEDDGVFYMSYEDFIRYYLVINICRLHRNYYNSCVQFKKTEVNKPNVSSIIVDKESQVYVQIHQKNLRFSLKSGKKATNVLMHIMVVDEKMNFIASGCDDTSTIFLSLNLKPGKYYVYSDINHRYVNVGDIAGYNVTTYSSNNVTFSKVLDQDPINICKGAIISYAKSNLNLEKRDNVQFYTPDNIIPEFPFIFIVVENVTGKISEVVLELQNNRESSIFPGENLKLKSLTKKLENNQPEVFFILRHRVDSSLQFDWNTRKIVK